MSERLQAIVMKSNDRKEKDESVLLFSIEEGKVWVTLKGVKQPKAKIKTATFQFAFGDFIVENGKSGKIVTGFDLRESFHEISEDIDKYFEASAVLQILDKLEFENQAERAEAFVLTLKSLKNICFSDVRRQYTLCKFLIEIFRLNGMPLYSEVCTCCGMKAFAQKYINFSTGEIVCPACKTFLCDEFSNVLYANLKILSNTDFDKLSTVRLAQNSEISLLKELVKIFETHFDCRLKLIGILD